MESRGQLQKKLVLSCNPGFKFRSAGLAAGTPYGLKISLAHLILLVCWWWWWYIHVVCRYACMFEYVFRSEINVRNFPISFSRFFICFLFFCFVFEKWSLTELGAHWPARLATESLGSSNLCSPALWLGTCLWTQLFSMLSAVYPDSGTCASVVRTLPAEQPRQQAFFERSQKT